MLPLHAPDGKHVVKLIQPGVAGSGVTEQTTGQALHGDEAHVVLLAQSHQLQILLRCQVAEGKLQRLIEPGLNGLVGHSQTVVGDTDVTDLSLCFELHYIVQILGLGLQGRLVEPGTVARLRTEGRIVKLIDINVVSLQHLQTVVQMLPEGLRIPGAGLGGDVDLVPHVVEGQTDLFLAVGVHVGCVKKGEARLVGAAQEPAGVVLADALDGQSTESILGRDDPGAAECNGFHGSSRLSSSGLTYFITI